MKKIDNLNWRGSPFQEREGGREGGRERERENVESMYEMYVPYLEIYCTLQPTIVVYIATTSSYF